MLLGLQHAKARLGQAVSELEVVFARLLAGNLGIERFPHGNVSFQKGANALPKELRAAQALADRGYNVQFVVTANQLGIENENTADTVVEGVGQVEFYTPTTTKEDNVVRMIIRKRKQAPILLMQTDMDAAIIQSIADRLWGNASARNIAKLFIQRSDGTVIEMSRPGKKD